KVMGLAPYGQPIYVDLIKNEIVRIFDDGSIHLNMRYFNYHYGLQMTGRRLEKLFGRKRRSPDDALTNSDRNIAASIQAVIEEIIFKMAYQAKRLTGEKNLCLSGGVALNCTASGKLLKSGIFDNIHIQPASSDSGGAVGAALYINYSLTDSPKNNNQPYFNLGPDYKNLQAEYFLNEINAPYTYNSDRKLALYVAEQLYRGKIIALFNGPMEFGPRALGFRSILASPASAEMKERINRAVKFREHFRPFAPVVIEQKASIFFDCNHPSPHMLFNFNVRPEKQAFIPAVTHIDGTARIQTVNREQNPILYSILEEFEKLSGLPILLNTSLNLRGHPIVRTPQEAFATFISSGIDTLVLVNCILNKEKTDWSRFTDYKIGPRHD
ncbi:MAG: hypothetical protein NTV06_02540, partial [candidate division Zixibacteria bacterium]|nr:hypothetical protein [candidate division Zixibacteria bacterium]